MLPFRPALGILANFLLIFSFVGFSLFFAPIIFQEISYRFFQKPQPEVRLTFGDILDSRQVAASFPAPDPEFSIVIPKISAEAKVFPNVSPADQNEYLPVLKKGVAHAKGTAFPGQKGNIYLFAHSTDSPINIARYNAVFYGLKDLEKDDQIVIFFEGRLHLYRVTEKKIVPASDVSYFEPQDKEEVLILQTCWPPGTTLDRLLVFAKKT
ncbi:MAG: sortase [bacterium]|nr:sortase [bacterium]